MTGGSRGVADRSPGRPQQGSPVCERGERFAVTAIRGVDPATGELGSTPDEQFRLAFAQLESLLEIAGLSPAEVGRLTVFTPDPAFRPLINPPWLRLYPDPGDRPARKTTHVPLPAGVAVELEAVGVRGHQRVSLEIDGVRHKDPLPMGALLDRHLFSSVIGPDVPGGGRAERVAALRQVFANASALVEAAGGTLDDISSVWTYLGMWDLHPEMVDVWVDNFPDPASRPARKTFYYPRVDVQLQLEAVLGGPRTNMEIPGISHHDPIPMGAVTGGVFTTSGVDGRDPESNKEPRGVAAQSRGVLANVDRLLAQIGGDRRRLSHITVLLGQLSYLGEFEPVWTEAFPDPVSAPALQVLELGLPARDILVQAIASGVLGPEPADTDR
jgi:2-iminobutanoate/2-iminopropanoate deaminase